MTVIHVIIKHTASNLKTEAKVSVDEKGRISKVEDTARAEQEFILFTGRSRGLSYDEAPARLENYQIHALFTFAQACCQPSSPVPQPAFNYGAIPQVLPLVRGCNLGN